MKIFCSIQDCLTCPVCAPHSPVCCQTVPGWRVMADLVKANSEAVWNMDLVRAVNTLSYQVRLSGNGRYL